MVFTEDGHDRSRLRLELNILEKEATNLPLPFSFISINCLELPGFGLGFRPRPLLLEAGSSAVGEPVSLLSGASLLDFLPRLFVLGTRRAGEGSAPNRTTANQHLESLLKLSHPYSSYLGRILQTTLPSLAGTILPSY